MASAPAGFAPGPRDDRPGGRPPELQDGLNRLVYHPLASRLARALKPTGISPNAVSVAGMLTVWAAAFAYTGLAWPLGVIAGLSFHLLWHVVDGADGDLARLTGKASPIGELVDGICDYSGHAVLYVALAAMLDDSIGGWAWALAAAAGASHAVQTNHAETQRRSYMWWVYGVPWLKHAKAAGDATFQARTLFTFTFGWMARIYLRGAAAMTPYAERIDEAAARAAGDPRERARVSRLVRRASRRALVLQKALGPNPRTLILGVSMAIGSPLWFFLVEAVALNLLLLVSIRHHNRVQRSLADRLAADPPPNG